MIRTAKHHVINFLIGANHAVYQDDIKPLETWETVFVCVVIVVF